MLNQLKLEAPDDAHVTSESEDLESWYRSFLPATTASSSEDEARLIYSYRHVFKGFAARLSPDHVKEMEKKKGFISAQPQKLMSVQTTHSPNFLGLNRNIGLWKDSNYGKCVIIGVVDNGVIPEHPSFSDEGMPPPPARWKGMARVNLFGNANDTAAGVAPLAHLAIYKVLLNNSGTNVDILAGMDAAIEDGVDVMSISINLQIQVANLYEDALAIGAFSAMEKGIFVSCSGGNNGPLPLSVGNVVPWVLTVGASTMDRKLSAKAMLGNNQQLEGESAFQPTDFTQKQFPLVYTPSCFNNSLSGSDIRGKIVVCELGRLTETQTGAATVSSAAAGGFS
ncbi:hypothetical protein SASPL_112612 [Salvia splendens]|uniref:Uncharacterized protein n=1 Tax=Salvia splendens TaxID=180675 RepID=A0A8X8Y938_SALSN|nr:hypothetical protein SASPL_112612 [Salvia splendens]